MGKVLLKFGEERRVLYINFGLLLSLLGYVLIRLVEHISDHTGVEWAHLVVVDLLPEDFERFVCRCDAVLGELGESLLKVFAKSLHEVRVRSLRPLGNSVGASARPEKREQQSLNPSLFQVLERDNVIILKVGVPLLEELGGAFASSFPDLGLRDQADVFVGACSVGCQFVELPIIFRRAR